MNDLIARLRGRSQFCKDRGEVKSPDLMNEAADHIEALVKERDEARHLQSCACNYDTPTDVCMGHHALFERLYAVKRVKLEAKLAKAMEALRGILKGDDMYPWRIAREVLAELEGGE